MPLGLIWNAQLQAGARIEDIAAKWPDLTVEDIARMIAVATGRLGGAPNQRK